MLVDTTWSQKTQVVAPKYSPKSLNRKAMHDLVKEIQTHASLVKKADKKNLAGLRPDFEALARFSPAQAPVQSIPLAPNDQKKNVTIKVETVEISEPHINTVKEVNEVQSLLLDTR